MHSSVGAQGRRAQVEDLGRPVRLAEHVHVIEVREDSLARAELPTHVLQGGVLTEGVQMRHERVSLLAAFALVDLVRLSVVVLPDVH